MKMQDILAKNSKLSLEVVAKDKELATQVQTRLIALRFLDPPADGLFGPISAGALKQFQDTFKIQEPKYLGPITAKKLIEAKITDLPKLSLKLGNDLASSLIKYMQDKGYEIYTGPQMYNIVYVEGMNPDGTLNDDAPNSFNDLRTVIKIINGVPEIVGKWEATTEPGDYWTYNPMNELGAARIKFGQYKSWQVGYHGTANPHLALVQVADITVYRDLNQDFSRIGDKEDTGVFYVNQHWGFDYDYNDVHNASAGCLVGRTTAGHRQFMSIVTNDKRYQANDEYIFTTTVIAGDDLMKKFPVASP